MRFSFQKKFDNRLIFSWFSVLFLCWRCFYRINLEKFKEIWVKLVLNEFRTLLRVGFKSNYRNSSKFGLKFRFSTDFRTNFIRFNEIRSWISIFTLKKEFFIPNFIKIAQNWREIVSSFPPTPKFPRSNRVQCNLRAQPIPLEVKPIYASKIIQVLPKLSSPNSAQIFYDPLSF